jgi:hypothetical protein
MDTGLVGIIENRHAVIKMLANVVHAINRWLELSAGMATKFDTI